MHGIGLKAQNLCLNHYVGFDIFCAMNLLQLKTAIGRVEVEHESLYLCISDQNRLPIHTENSIKIFRKNFKILVLVSLDLPLPKPDSFVE